MRRIRFSGFHSADTNALIFALLDTLPNLQSVSLPWTTLRHSSGGGSGRGDQWARLLGNREGRNGPLESLELVAFELKASEIALAAAATATDTLFKKPLLDPLDAPEVDFGSLARLKIVGNSNYMPLTDEDMCKIARTATSLRKIHITGTAHVSMRGIMALVRASGWTLRTLEYTPFYSSSSSSSFSSFSGDPDSRIPSPLSIPTMPPMPDSANHICAKKTPRLRTPALPMPICTHTVCAALFAAADEKGVLWEEEGAR